MTIFSKIFNRFFHLDFSDSQIKRLTDSTNELKQICIKVDYTVYNDLLSQALDAAAQGESKRFKKIVISNDFFGGAGALWELYVSDKNLQLQFDKCFCNWVDCLIGIGIRNGRVRQVRRDKLD